MPKSTDALIALEKHAADVLALAELLRDHVESVTAGVANSPVLASWGAVGDMGELRRHLVEALVVSRLDGDCTEAEAAKMVEDDIEEIRSAG